MDPRRLVMRLSLAASVFMLVGKVGAYILTHSAAILSDAAESVVHGVATGLAAFSLWYADRPPDPNHPYGHGRIAYFSAGFEGALVLVAGCAVIASGVHGLVVDRELTHLGTGMIIEAGLVALNLALGMALVTVGRNHGSLILVANGKHVLSDMWTTIAAILGVGLVYLTGLRWFDGTAAILIGAWIIGSGISLLRKSFAGLMDEVDAVSSAVIAEELQKSVAEGLIRDFHHLRHREVNGEEWIDVHMLVPGKLSVEEAHGRVTQVEERIAARLTGEVHITSHIEPLDHARAHPDGHALATDPLTPEHPATE